MDDGRRALEEGRAERCPEGCVTRWRCGADPPLSDFQYEPFAQRHIARLEEERLTALEARIEADLALGRHAEIVGELEDLVARPPAARAPARRSSCSRCTGAGARPMRWSPIAPAARG